MLSRESVRTIRLAVYPPSKPSLYIPRSSHMSECTPKRLIFSTTVECRVAISNIRNESWRIMLAIKALVGHPSTRSTSSLISPLEHTFQYCQRCDWPCNSMLLFPRTTELTAGYCPPPFSSSILPPFGTSFLHTAFLLQKWISRHRSKNNIVRVPIRARRYKNKRFVPCAILAHTIRYVRTCSTLMRSFLF